MVSPGAELVVLGDRRQAAAAGLVMAGRLELYSRRTDVYSDSRLNILPYILVVLYR